MPPRPACLQPPSSPVRLIAQSGCGTPTPPLDTETTTAMYDHRRTGRRDNLAGSLGTLFIHFLFVFQDLMRILYVGENMQHLQAEGERGESAGADGKAGIRVLGVSPDGQHLAAGDRCGNVQ